MYLYMGIQKWIGIDDIDIDFDIDRYRQLILDMKHYAKLSKIQDWERILKSEKE